MSEEQVKEEELVDEIVGNYRMEKTIGQGTYGKVRLGINQITGEKVAIKVIDKSQIQSPKQVARLQREIRFLKLLNHPHIVKVYDVIEGSEFIYIVMEYAIGGELFDYIVAHKRVKEKEARSFFRMVLSAVEYCHQNAVIHRDLKPENLLLDENRSIKIIDFGFGNNFTVDKLLDTFCGSPFYAAPEMILGKKYEGPEVDMWSLGTFELIVGVILFALLCGHLPFDDDNMKELYKKIASGSYKCPDYLLPSARHLISRLITVDPKKRATLQEVISHPWVQENYDNPPPNFIPDRPVITDAAQLSKDITNRLQIFGYKMNEIVEAFSPGQDLSRPNAIRATYHLLSEMVIRERARMANEQKKVNVITNLKKPYAVLSANSSPQITSPPPSSAPPVKPVYPHQATDSFKNKEYSSSTMALSDIQANGNYKNVDSMQKMYPDKCNSNWKGKDAEESEYLRAKAVESSQRRVSQPLDRVPNSPSARKNSAAEKIKEELRTVSGWFLNVTTTSSKPPQEISELVRAVLEDINAIYRLESTYTFICEINMASLQSGLGKNEKKPENEEMICEDGDGGSETTSSWFKGKPQGVVFLIEICQVPRMALHGLHFKRISGGVWNYKKVCNKILSQLAL